MADFIAKKPFSSIRWGNIQAGDPVDNIDKTILRQMVESGMVEMTAEYAARLRQEQAIEAAKTAKAKK